MLIKNHIGRLSDIKNYFSAVPYHDVFSRSKLKHADKLCLGTSPVTTLFFAFKFCIFSVLP